jgi:ubiquinone/menaquinone biosynthesis C-methylase UbiE
MQNINYDKIASTYARHRRANLSVLEELQRRWPAGHESKILEIGCGTGIYLQSLVKATGCQGWGIDPSREMIRYAQSDDNALFFEANAEELPFNGKLFDLAFSVNVVHFMQNTLSYFQEARRVLKPDGLLCTVTDSESIIRNRKPLSQYWPETVEIELKRYPAISLLKQQMAAAGFVDIEEKEIQIQSEITDATPYRDRVFSCLHLISEDEFQRGLQRLEADLKAGPIPGFSAYVCLWATTP